MKKSFLFLLCLVATLVASANPVTVEQAAQQARQFVQQRVAATGQHRAPAQLNLQQAMPQQADAAYYVFNVGTDNGFVIVSADDRATPILGYSLSGSVDEATMPDNMREWLKGYERELQWMNEHGVQPATTQTSTVRKSIAPLLTSKWDQGAPFNDATPEYQYQVTVNGVTSTVNAHAVTGCVATAMAQLMYYHKWPQSACSNIPSYDDDGTTREPLNSTTFNWDNMYDTYDNGEDGDEVAKLMKYCGYSVWMNYGMEPDASSGTSTSYVADALVDYFDYDPGIQIVDRSDLVYNDWIDAVYQELKANRPVLFSGQGSGGGHAFVCDGYDQDDFFAFNWGWGGMSDGYFKLSALNPNTQGIGGSSNGDGFNIDQYMIIGIQPNTGVEPEEPYVAMTVTGISSSTTSQTRTSPSSDFPSLTVTQSCYNQTGGTHTFDVSVRLYQGEEIIKTFSSVTTQQLDNGWGYSSISRTISFGKNLPNGKYTIKAISRKSGTTTWYPDYGSDKYYIEATINGNTLTLNNMSVVENLYVNSVTFTGSKKCNEEQEVVVNVTNNGTYYNGDLSMRFNNTKADGVHIEMAAGETREIKLYFTPDVYGNNIGYTIHQGYYTDTQIYSGTVNISAPAPTTNNIELAVSHIVNNAEGNNVFGNKASVTVTLTNSSTSNYNGALVLYTLFKTNSGEETGWSYNGYYVTVPAGTTRSFEMESDDLNFGNKYSFYAKYYKNGNYYCPTTYLNSSKSKNYTAVEGYATYDSNGVKHMVKTQNSISVSEDVSCVDLRGLSTVKSVSSQGNPNTVFLLDAGKSLTGATNVVKGTTAESITLTDGYPFYSPIAFTATDITYTRTFTKGYAPGAYGWETIMLPFDVTGVTANGTAIDWFRNTADTGKQFWVMEFDGDNGTSATYKHAAEMEAYMPYIIAVPGNQYPSFDLTGKSIVFSGSNAKIRANEYGNTTLTGPSLKFTGTQTQKDLEDVYTLDDAGHQFVQGDKQVKSFHAYIRPTSINASRTIRLSFNGEATGIDATLNDHVEMANDHVYDLQGRKVNVRSAAGRLLPAGRKNVKKGLYIINGKKVIK